MVSGDAVTEPNVGVPCGCLATAMPLYSFASTVMGEECTNPYLWSW
jgi:hypothetical protein